jgi:hypothetical protein
VGPLYLFRFALLRRLFTAGFLRRGRGLNTARFDKKICKSNFFSTRAFQLTINDVSASSRSSAQVHAMISMDRATTPTFCRKPPCLGRRIQKRPGRTHSYGLRTLDARQHRVEDSAHSITVSNTVITLMNYIKQLETDKAEAIDTARTIETEINNLISYLYCDKFRVDTRVQVGDVLRALLPIRNNVSYLATTISRSTFSSKNK